jgi:hypothetical protein
MGTHWEQQKSNTSTLPPKEKKTWVSWEAFMILSSIHI